MRARAWVRATIGALLAVSSAACGEDAPLRPPAPAGPDAGSPRPCVAGEFVDDGGACKPAGLPADMTCAPGEWQPTDGAACVPAGVPPDACAEGFMHDGDGGCAPILPASACGPGTMAVPGETTCREPSACGVGTWGDIPVDAMTQHVDGSYPGGDSDGSASKPWTTIGAAILAAESGAIVAVAQGSYEEDVRIELKPVRLWGVCPSLVEIVGTSAALAAIVIGVEANGAEVRGVALTGPAFGISFVSSQDVVVEGVWIHDTGSRGIDIVKTTDPIRATLRASLVEAATESGIRTAGGELTIESSVVRSTQPTNTGDGGNGVTAWPGPLFNEPATLSIAGSLIESNLESGVLVLGSKAAIFGTLVRDTDTNLDGIRGWGVHAQIDEGMRASLEVVGSVFERNHRYGIAILAADATVDATVVRSTLSDDAGEFESGYGVHVQAYPAEAEPGTLSMRGSLIEDNRIIGVAVSGSTAALEGTLVRRTQTTSDGRAGGGVTALGDPAIGQPTSVELRGCRIEDNREAAIGSLGADATIEGTAVRRTELDAMGGYGVGVLVQGTAELGTGFLVLRNSLIEESHSAGLLVVDTTAVVETSEVRATLPDVAGFLGRGVQIESDFSPASATLRGVLVRDCRDAAVFAFGAHAELDGCVLSNTATNDTGALGDGLAVAASPATAKVTGTRIEKSARAAISAFGASVSVDSSTFVCQKIDLAGADFEGFSYAFDDGGGNACGCPEPIDSCVATSPSVEAPKPIGGLE